MMAMRQLRTALLVLLVTAAVVGCATPGQRLAGTKPPAGLGAAIITSSVVQRDAVDRSGNLVLRKLEPGADRFLPEAPDTVARVAILPAFRLSELLRRGDLTGRTRLASTDLTPIVLSPGRWAIERAYTSATTGNLILSSNSLVGITDSRLSSWAFDIQADEIVALPLMLVSPNDRWGPAGPASVQPGEGLPQIIALAAERGLAVEPRDWVPTTVECAPIRYEGFQLRGEVECAPR